MSELKVLTEDKCRELLTAGVVGRVALCTAEGPQIFPVNYVVHDGSVVFRTTPYSMLGARGWQTRLAFEIDHLDHEHRSGWSVVAVGPGEQIEHGPELDEVTRAWGGGPWAGGNRPLFIRLRWDSLTGRSVGSS